MNNGKRSQLERVKEKLEREGWVDNFWAIENYILRLGAIILTLKKSHGMHITGYTGKMLKKERQYHRNYYYQYTKPEPIRMFEPKHTPSPQQSLL